MPTSRPPRPVAPGKPKRIDYEYKRNGTRNVFLFLEPKAGRRHTLVTRRRTKHQWAYAMRYLVDELYPDAVMIDVVLDNLNTHLADVLIEIFGKAEADRILSRLTFHYTPLHSSWLNMAEIELSVMERQCLRRRLPDELTLATELIAWERPRNDAQVKIAGSSAPKMPGVSLPSTTPHLQIVKALGLSTAEYRWWRPNVLYPTLMLKVPMSAVCSPLYHRPVRRASGG